MDAHRPIATQHEAGDALARICAFPCAAGTALDIDATIMLDHGDHIAASASIAFHETIASASLMLVTRT